MHCIFSQDRLYRYTLWRSWADDLFRNRTKEGYVQFIGLNPSTADEVQDDPTIRRCMGFTKAWGYNLMCMTNIFAFRATDPNVMKAQSEPVGESNDWHLIEIAKKSAVTVASWGVHGIHNQRAKAVQELFNKNNLKLHYLKLTKDKYPWHPLYLKSDLVPVLWSL